MLTTVTNMFEALAGKPFAPHEDTFSETVGIFLGRVVRLIALTLPFYVLMLAAWLLWIVVTAVPSTAWKPSSEFTRQSQEISVIGILQGNTADNPIEIDKGYPHYRIPGRMITIKIRVTNRGVTPISFAQEEGVEIDNDSPIGPGQSKIVTVSMSDETWETINPPNGIVEPNPPFPWFLPGGTPIRPVIPPVWPVPR